ncbi:MAG: NAD(P)-dependent oxidoreductase [Pseudodesulfovibrio sp.]|nr:NAD(P)-dependent oxidoreductase [Pseudodesulfovibrio sp.]
MSDKVVVIGGSGFLGSHLADELTVRGYEVVVYDRTQSAWLRDDQSMVIGSLSDTELLNETIAGSRYVYHLAGIADIKEAGTKPVEVIKDNILGSANVVEACLADGNIERFVFASSVYVYSDQGSFYRVSKQAVESLLETYHSECGLPYTVLRYGSLYGPRSQDWNGLKVRIRQAVNEGKIEYPGTGKELREYIHIKDAARMSVDALGLEFANACFTLTGTQVLSSKELLDLINEIMGGQLEISFTDSVASAGHYGMTPYRYTPKKARKMVPTTFYDIGQGVLELIEEVHQAMEEGLD